LVEERKYQIPIEKVKKLFSVYKLIEQAKSWAEKLGA
jgi:hypothetical protein